MEHQGRGNGTCNGRYLRRRLVSPIANTISVGYFFRYKHQFFVQHRCVMQTLSVCIPTNCVGTHLYNIQLGSHLRRRFLVFDQRRLIKAHTSTITTHPKKARSSSCHADGRRRGITGRRVNRLCATTFGCNNKCPPTIYHNFNTPNFANPLSSQKNIPWQQHTTLITKFTEKNCSL
jgi:hypothetical protein